MHEVTASFCGYDLLRGRPGHVQHRRTVPATDTKNPEQPNVLISKAKIETLKYRRGRRLVSNDSFRLNRTTLIIVNLFMYLDLTPTATRKPFADHTGKR